MRKFFAKLFLALLPFLFFTTLFIIYEPYNYWGLKGEKSGKRDVPLARVRAFMRNPSENIILGDSRMGWFDLDYIEESTGIRYVNLQTGGQALNLTREMYDWAQSKVNIQNLVLDASFYQLNNHYYSYDSAKPAFYIAEHPLTYLTTRDYVLEVAELMIKDISSFHLIPFASAVKVEDSETWNATAGKYESYLVDYAKNILSACSDYSIGKQQMDDLLYILDDCRENGAQTLVVLPPVHESIWDLVIYPLNLEKFMAEYKAILSQHTETIDMEWLSDFSRTTEYYLGDGFHFNNPPEGYQQFTDAIFLKKGNFFRIIPYER